MPERLTTILVIDDDAGDVSLLRNLLDYRWDGRFRLIHIEDLATAVTVAGRERVDVILLDLSLPDSHGLETFLKLYARCPHVPIVVLSSFDDELLAMKAVQAGAQDYLVKGQIGEQLLVRSVRYAIERSGRENAEETLRMTAAKFRVARDIQRSLFPAQSPQIAELEIAGMTKPAEETGGDFFDYLRMPDGTLAVAVADVSSHGLGSALLMAETRAYLRALALSRADIGEILTLMNRILVEDVAGKHFVTLFLARFDPARRLMRYVAAGHAGYLLDPGGGTRTLDSTGLPLGIEKEIVFQSGSEIELTPGQVVFICTDGIQEAQSPNMQMFGTRRALEAVRRHLDGAAEEMLQGLSQAVTAHIATREQHDDITMVVVKVR
jgi:sigma-B regulation protein RsbU (phosphoserine phosphatase)